ncbi:ABC transporter substrate-binding protein [Leisingera daeponensis]|uniref:ABC transporter substrate-binding protein n=1 Tax=Leisingera daeponensis TaxID=405746 RepID=UPI001C9491BC|nr:ABC transporter substrate-binding protein [Leisingera daeponensis]MBY6058755.1 ABC transporter substrate-binding protein [Leisingera daeponensis]
MTFKRMTATVAVAASFLTASAAVAEPESNQPIRISQGDWTGNVFTSTLAAELLGKMGYNVQIVPITGASVYSSLGNGDLTVQIEGWSTSEGDLIDAAVATGKVENLGSMGLVGMDRWWYPSYIKEDCPGLPSYKALNDCAKLFSTVETGDSGRLLLYPDDWGGFDEERVKALGLNFKVAHAGGEAALLAEVQSAYKRRAPILVWLYEPHWAPATFDGEYVELPPYTEECYQSESYACEKPTGPIYKVVNADMVETWPKAYAFMKNFQISNEEYGNVIKKIDVDKTSVEDVVADWIAKNQDRWSAWMQ